MKQLSTALLLAASALAVQVPVFAQAQSQEATTNQEKLTQKVRGRVVDAASKEPMAGVLVLLQSDNQINAMTDNDGYFVLHHTPVGRQSFQFSFMGYEPYVISGALVTSGKALELNVTMVESLQQLEEVTITGRKNKIQPLNEFAAISARSFSVEETRRYAASFSDPARMVMNFPGVSNAGDMDNSIVVRGNSPKGVLWRLEGIEIPNPNHFSTLGGTGGPISMLNANVLGNSDFYTGAFAPEIGNATAGAFDINFRNGNTEQYEHTFSAGAIGMEAATEGPFKRGKKSSYLINYRYSTLDLLEGFMNLGGTQPDYQDGSFKLNFPTKKAGTFTVFGLGGYNRAFQKASADSSKWSEDNENLSYDSRGKMGVAGITHQYFLANNAYIKTIISASYDNHGETSDTLNPGDSYHIVPVSNTSFTNKAVRASVLYNQKLNACQSLRAGVVAQHLGYDMDFRFYADEDKEWKSMLNGSGSTEFYQAYTQWKFRFTENLTLVSGIHASFLALNSKFSVEPRAALTYHPNRNKFTLSAGMHSKPEHISTYFYEKVTANEAPTHPNKDLDLLRSIHTVAGYETVLPFQIRFKAEAYYQRHYNIPVGTDPNISFSLLNAESIYSLTTTEAALVSEGTGENYGIDLSLERPFANNYYILATGSIYKATYTDYWGNTYNSRFNRGHHLNIIGGKEFPLKADGRKIIGLNGKLMYSGGLRESEIDLEQSILQRKEVILPGKYFTKQGPAYFRADASVYYKINNKKATHTIQLDVQNLTNRENYWFSYFDADAGRTKRVNQLGILPNITYRIDFHW